MSRARLFPILGWALPLGLAAAALGCAGAPADKPATGAEGGADGAADGAHGADGSADGADGSADGADTAPTGPDCTTDAEQWSEQAAPLLAAECSGCHQAAGPASASRLLLLPLSEDGALDANLAVVQALIAADAALLLRKPTGQTAHGGGQRFDVLDARYAVLHELVARIGAPGGCAHPGPLPLRCDDGERHPGSAPLRRLHAAQAEAAVLDAFGLRLPVGIFPAHATGSGAYRTSAAANSMSASGVESVQLAAEWVSQNADIDGLLTCGLPDQAACAEAAIRALGERLYRRPLLTAEADVLLRFLRAGLPPAEALGMAIEVMLQSPQHLYLDARPRAEDAAEDQPHIDDHALAARMAALLNDGPPDAALRAAAASGALRSRAGVAAEAARLLEKPEAVPVVVRFHEDWLHLYRMGLTPKDPTLYPEWSDAFEQLLKDEQALFVGEVVWMGGGRFDDLLHEPTGWVNDELAAIFDLPDPGPGWARVRHDPDWRGGVLTRPAFLAAHSYTASSSPVRRGAWVLEALLCQDLSPPPGVSLELPEPSSEAPTIRERLAAHTADPACASCHDSIDPIGLAFEHYGVIGELRDQWSDGYPIDATGSIGDPAGSFDGAAELVSLIGGTERAQACYARRWFEYGVGRGAEPEDACSLDTLAERFVEGGGDIRSLLIDITLTDAFLARESAADPADPPEASP